VLIWGRFRSNDNTIKGTARHIHSATITKWSLSRNVHFFFEVICIANRIIKTTNGAPISEAFEFKPTKPRNSLSHTKLTTLTWELSIPVLKRIVPIS
jgi:hypothetical protein